MNLRLFGGRSGRKPATRDVADVRFILILCIAVVFGPIIALNAAAFAARSSTASVLGGVDAISGPSR